LEKELAQRRFAHVPVAGHEPLVVLLGEQRPQLNLASLPLGGMQVESAGTIEHALQTLKAVLDPVYFCRIPGEMRQLQV